MSSPYINLFAQGITPTAYAMRAFAPGARKHGRVTITAEGVGEADCKRRLRAICKDYRLPVRRTMKTARRIRKAFVR